ncbi:hypothetical protein PF002_g17814 [Phytophthora fragariae]|uniref:Uncharacterized protein n=1 Tax=Phytophthora fragariae TaxID=53985 RepID=A0A6A3Y852_9STRA|nr:hypothetical protein PF002_g17814 [Phytophthora fragariae]
MVMFYGDDAAVLTGAVVQLPAPDAMAEGTAPYHSLFSPESESSHASGKRPAPRGPGKSKAPPAKKQRKPPKKAIFTFNLSSSTPAMIKIALANIMQASGFQGAESDVEELSHSGLTEDSEESGGGVVGKTGKGESGGRTPGDSGGSRKPSRSQVGERSAPTSPVTEAKQATEI